MFKARKTLDVGAAFGVIVVVGSKRAGDVEVATFRSDGPYSDGRRPDYSRGFSGRPQLRSSTELAGTEYDDGWGAHCYQQKPDAADNDRSFRSWTCAEGLACQVVGNASRVGMCFVKSR